jgi:hypothetical protein
LGLLHRRCCRGERLHLLGRWLPVRVLSDFSDSGPCP